MVKLLTDGSGRGRPGANHRRECAGPKGDEATMSMLARINGEGTLTVRATKAASDTVLAKIIRMVGDAHARRAAGRAMGGEVRPHLHAGIVMAARHCQLPCCRRAFSRGGAWGYLVLQRTRAAGDRLPVCLWSSRLRSPSSPRSPPQRAPWCADQGRGICRSAPGKHHCTGHGQDRHDHHGRARGRGGASAWRRASAHAISE